MVKLEEFIGFMNNRKYTIFGLSFVQLGTEAEQDTIREYIEVCSVENEEELYRVMYYLVLIDDIDVLLELMGRLLYRYEEYKYKDDYSLEASACSL